MTMSTPFFIQATEKNLPLLIGSASAENDSLTLSGEDWSFSTSSAWRVLNNSGLAFGCETDDASEAISTLIGHKIVGVQPSNSSNLDIQFNLDNDLLVECFTTHFFEPWVLKLPDNTIMVADGNAT